MTRFFVSPQQMQPDFLVLTGENAVHANVLRLKNGEQVLVCDGDGNECVCVVSDISRDQVCLVVKSRQCSQTEACVDVRVYIAFPKGDKLEHVIQKATELGASSIIAFPSSRCVSKPDEKSLRKKLERWQKIAASAAEQSGRGRIPEVRVVSGIEAAMKDALRAEKVILFYENEKAKTLAMALKCSTFSSISIMTGPEGGLDEKEVNRARELGMEICTLGSRILRCETAPLCALSAIMYHCGEF